MAELTNDFTWSKSRHEKFGECLRAYYYQYYGSWGGWEADTGSAERELYVLKKLSSRFQWAGSLVHDALKELLVRARHTGRYRTADEVVARTLARARAQWSSSREKAYWREASRISGLIEHEYGEPVPGEEWKRLWAAVSEASLRGFFASDAFARLQAVPREAWLTVDELDDFVFEGTKVWVAVDLAYRDGEGRIHIVDWKTGQEREVDRVQVGVYGLHARQKWNVAPEQVVGELVYLAAPGSPTVAVPIDAAAIAATESVMRDSMSAMRARLDDAERNRTCVERFPQLPEPARCSRCAFRRPCGRM